MDHVLNIYKPQGMTPLQVIEWVRRTYPEYRNEKMTYAGRLDPMAEGVLLILVGSAVHKKSTYTGLDKTYEVDVVFGYATDTHDLLGLPTRYDDAQTISKERIMEEIGNMKGVSMYPFPAYASKPVQGKPLFQWAREGRLHEITIPHRTMCVHAIELLAHYTIAEVELYEIIKTRIAKVRGDFRQQAIVEQWRECVTRDTTVSPFPAIRLRIHCASGTYMRTLAHELGIRLGSGATVLQLVRSSVGNFDERDAIVLS